MTKNIDDMTGEELKEEFFTEIKGWERKIPVENGVKLTTFAHWHVDGGKSKNQYSLPKIDTDLNAFEEWVWPELRKLEEVIEDVRFDAQETKWDSTEVYKWNCRLRDWEGRTFSATATSKPLAQLKAAMKALSKEKP